MKGYLVVNLPSKGGGGDKQGLLSCALPYGENRDLFKTGSHVIYVSHVTTVDEYDADHVSVVSTFVWGHPYGMADDRCIIYLPCFEMGKLKCNKLYGCIMLYILNTFIQLLSAWSSAALATNQVNVLTWLSCLQGRCPISVTQQWVWCSAAVILPW